MLRTIWIVMLVAAAALPAAGEGLTLAKDGRSDYTIVVAKGAGPSEKWAAEQLAAYVKQMSGAELKVVAESANLPTKAVVIGDGPAARALGVTIDAKALGDDGFALKTSEQSLVIAGGRKRGTMYGVFEVLQRLGCRWWYPGESSIPTKPTLTLPALDERQVPAMEYRDMLYGENNSSEAAMLWRAANKVNGGFYKTSDAKRGGVWTFDTLVHSYTRLMPPGKYFKEHPEYFALTRGKRSNRQPCFANPEVPKIMAATLKAELAKHPEWNHVTVGQNDNNNYCTCDDCKALAAKYGSLQGMQMHLAHEVTKLLRTDYPKITVNVPAYRWSRKPTKGIGPVDNSIITLCSIECNFGRPLAEGYPQANAAFKADIEGWAKVAPKLYIWDYTTNFTHYILPFPNYYVLQPNVKFFVDHKVRGYMAQGSHTTRHGQFAPLCMWVLAKALWNPEVDGRKLVRDFILGYYGPAAGPAVLKYADMLHAAVQKDRTPLWCTRGTWLSAAYLTPELMAAGDALFRKAEAAVKDDPALLKRVRADHVPLLYVMIRRPIEMIPAVAKATPGLTLAKVMREFSAYGRAARINRVREGDHATELFDWCDDMAKRVGAGSALPAPAEAAKADPAKVRLIQTAQMDGQVKFMAKAEGASDGWAFKVVSPGWSIQHKLGAPWDFTVGRSYRVYARVKAVMVEGEKGVAFGAGIHNPGRSRTCAKGLKAPDATGDWQVIDLGPWTPDAKGGSFYAHCGRSGVKQVLLDCIWLAEQDKAK